MRKSEYDSSKRRLINISQAPADVLNQAASSSADWPTGLAVPNPYPLSRAQAGATIHNYQATVSTTATLPTNALPGERFFLHQVAAQNMVLDPGAAGIFVDGATTSTVGQKLTSSAVASQVEVVCIDAGPTWLLHNKTGTFAIA